MKKVILHAGCGNSRLPPEYAHCDEVRLDIDELLENKPDIIANMAQLPDGIGPYDAVYCCHALEHLYPYDVVPCLEGFLRVLKPGAPVILQVPDLEGVEANDETLYVVNGVEITGLDMIYGCGAVLKEWPAMAHHCGFVQKTLRAVLGRAGFERIGVHKLPQRNLFAVAYKP